MPRGSLAQAGDADAFSQLIERTRVIALALAFRLIANPETVRDVIQEAMLQAFLSLDRLRDTTRFKSWFYGIVLNLCRTWLRQQHTRTLSLEALATQWQAGTFSSFLDVPDPSETVEEQELYQLVQEKKVSLWYLVFSCLERGTFGCRMCSSKWWTKRHQHLLRERRKRRGSSFWLVKAHHSPKERKSHL